MSCHWCLRHRLSIQCNNNQELLLLLNLLIRMKYFRRPLTMQGQPSRKAWLKSSKVPIIGLLKTLKKSVTHHLNMKKSMGDRCSPVRVTKESLWLRQARMNHTVRTMNNMGRSTAYKIQTCILSSSIKLGVRLLCKKPSIRMLLALGLW